MPNTAGSAIKSKDILSNASSASVSFAPQAVATARIARRTAKKQENQIAL